MSYKITRKDDAYFYEAPNHYDMRPTRLHDAKDVNEGQLIMGMSHFLPGGGCKFGSNKFESIYYIIRGNLDIEVEGGETTTLYAGDSFHCGPNTKKGIQNNTKEVVEMLVVLKAIS